MEVIRFLF
jgi:hypothetical protein